MPEWRYEGQPLAALPRETLLELLIRVLESDLDAEETWDGLDDGDAAEYRS